MNDEVLHPVEMLRVIVDRLSDPALPLTSQRLHESFQHLQNAIADTFEGVEQQLSQAFREARQGIDTEAARQLIDEAQREVSEALNEVRESFLSSTSFQDFEQRSPDLQRFEARLEVGLSWLEQAVAMVEVPAAVDPPAALHPEVLAALDSVSEGVAHLQQHLESADRAWLERAVQALEQGLLGLKRGL